MGKLKYLNAVCYFCNGYKRTKFGKIVRVKGGGRAFKCKDCLDFDKQIKNVKSKKA